MPKYAILSHVWGKEEVTFEDIGDLFKARRMLGFEKIRLSCVQAKRDGLQYVWVDTCCIDKSSSSELSEAVDLNRGSLPPSTTVCRPRSSIRTMS